MRVVDWVTMGVAGWEAMGVVGWDVIVKVDGDGPFDCLDR